MGYFLHTAMEYMIRKLPVVIIILVVFFWIRRQLIRKERLHRGSHLREISVFVFTAYLALVFSLTFTPIRFTFPQEGFRFQSTLLAMMRGEYTTGEWGLTMLAGNVVMLMPLGFLMPVLWKQCWWQTLAIALAVILCIELLQPFVGRSFDIDDIFLNFTGAAIGLILSIVPRVVCPQLVRKLRE